MWHFESLIRDDPTCFALPDNWLPILVSCLALVFTIFSFWWMNWRPAKLNVGNLRLFGAGKASEGGHSHNIIVVALPLTLWNSGARAIVIEDLKLVPYGKVDIPELSFARVDSPLTTTSIMGDEEIQSDYFYLPIALKANDVIQANFVFNSPSSEFIFEPTNYDFFLQARLTKKSRWKKIKKISLDFVNLDSNGLYKLNELFTVFPYRTDHKR